MGWTVVCVIPPAVLFCFVLPVGNQPIHLKDSCFWCGGTLPAVGSNQQTKQQHCCQRAILFSYFLLFISCLHLCVCVWSWSWVGLAVLQPAYNSPGINIQSSHHLICCNNSLAQKTTLQQFVHNHLQRSVGLRTFCLSYCRLLSGLVLALPCSASSPGPGLETLLQFTHLPVWNRRICIPACSLSLELLLTALDLFMQHVLCFAQRATKFLYPDIPAVFTQLLRSAAGKVWLRWLPGTTYHNKTLTGLKLHCPLRWATILFLRGSNFKTALTIHFLLSLCHLYEVLPWIPIKIKARPKSRNGYFMTDTSRQRKAHEDINEAHRRKWNAVSLTQRDTIVIAVSQFREAVFDEQLHQCHNKACPNLKDLTCLYVF